MPCRWPVSSGMPHPVCSLCIHPRRAEIDADLLSGLSTVAVAKKYGCQQTTFARHLRLHLKPHLHAIARAAGPMLLPPTPQAQAAILIPSIGGLLDKLGSTIDRAEKLVADAEADGSIPARAVSLNALKSALVDTAKLLAMLGPQGPKDVTPEQVDKRAVREALASVVADDKDGVL